MSRGLGRQNALFQTQQFRERPGLEGAAARGVRRFGVGDFRNVPEAGGGEMFVEWRQKSCAED